MSQITTKPTVIASPYSGNIAAVVIRSIDVFNLLAAEKGATFITFVAQTEPKMTRTGNPFVKGKGKTAIVDVVKTARINAQVNFWYDTAVLRELAKEGKSPSDFKKGESWHEPVLRPDGSLTPFLQHKTKGTYYLRARVLNVLETSYTHLDGTPIDKKDIEPFLVKSDYSNQGTDVPIVFCAYGLETLRELTLNGVTYVLQG